MNPILADLYGTGMDKLAHEDEGYDLSDLSDEELLLLADEEGYLDDDEDYFDDDGEYALDKMASEGDLEYWDMAGRIMAHAYADEFDKVASADEFDEFDEFDYLDAEYVDLNDLDAEDLYELAMEKEAGARDMARRLAMATNPATIPARLAARSRAVKTAIRGARAGGRRAQAFYRSPTGQGLVAGARAQGADVLRRASNTPISTYVRRANPMVPFAEGAAGLAQSAYNSRAGRRARKRAGKAYRSAMSATPAQLHRAAKKAYTGSVKKLSRSPGGKAFKRAKARNMTGQRFKAMVGNRIPRIAQMSNADAGTLAMRLAMGGGAAGALAVGGAAYGMSRNK